MSNPYNRWSDALKYFHDHFRHSIADIAGSLRLSASSNPAQPPVLSLEQLKALHRNILELTRGLTMHHTIEDRTCFPVLCKKIPEFGELSEQHHQLEEMIAQLTDLARLPMDKNTDLSSHTAQLQSGMTQLQLLALPHMAAEEELTLPAKTRLLFTEREMSSLFG